ncbi:DUF2092 domain-containing protein [Formosa sp. S-31]|uniref:DUF2092 domain-containing protein n=1 Tax=Formosa sp. S-31 TaxID=2790949 RepID=UPI003EBD020A
MKKHLIILTLFLLPFLSRAQSSSDTIDLDALVALDQMGETIGTLTSVTFHLSVVTDQLDENNKLYSRPIEHEVTMVGPDKMLVKSFSLGRNRGYWYNGDHLTYYSFNENNYVTIPAPSNIMDMIEFMHTKFDMYFPAADFFYPSFTDDLLQDFKTITFKGEVNLGGHPCYELYAENDKMTAQLWILAETYNLPKKFILTYKQKNNQKYEAIFSDWDLNPEVPDAIFDFTPPANAKLISVLLAKS